MPEGLKSDKWTSMGFQGSDPRTDFRGAGLLGLKCLVYFMDKYPDAAERMRNNGEDYFFFAVSCCNMSYALSKFLCLTIEGVPQHY